MNGSGFIKRKMERNGAGAGTSVIHLKWEREGTAFCLPVQRQPRRGGKDICHGAME